MFVGNWDYVPDTYKSKVVRGEVLDESGKRVRKVKLSEHNDAHSLLFRGFGLLDISMMGGMEISTRFPGMSRAIVAEGALLPNYEIRLSPRGPRFLEWCRIYPHVFLNSRAYYFKDSVKPLYLPASVLAGEPASSNGYYEMGFPTGEDGSEPAMLLNRELGAGLSAYIPIDPSAALEVGGGVILRQSAVIRFRDQPVIGNEKGVPGDKIKHIIDYPGRDFYLDLGVRIGVARVSMRTYFRSANLEPI